MPFYPRVLQGQDKDQARIDYDVEHHGVRKLKVEPGTWVQQRSGNGYVHSVAAYQFYRHYGKGMLHGKTTDDQDISHATVEFRCGNRSFDNRLMQIRDPMAHEAQLCRRCLAKLVT